MSATATKNRQEKSGQKVSSVVLRKVKAQPGRRSECRGLLDAVHGELDRAKNQVALIELVLKNIAPGRVQVDDMKRLLDGLQEANDGLLSGFVAAADMETVGPTPRRKVG